MALSGDLCLNSGVFPDVVPPSSEILHMLLAPVRVIFLEAWASTPGISRDFQYFQPPSTLTLLASSSRVFQSPSTLQDLRKGVIRGWELRKG